MHLRKHIYSSLRINMLYFALCTLLGMMHMGQFGFLFSHFGDWLYYIFFPLTVFIIGTKELDNAWEPLLLLLSTFIFTWLIFFLLRLIKFHISRIR